MTRELPLLGFGLPVSGSWATPATMTAIAQRAERLGYASLWTFQRLLQPVEGTLDPDLEARTNPGSAPADDAVYAAVHDPLLPLAYVAASTRRIGLGTATICAPFTPPAVLAKSLATLDVLSGGRLTAGLGMGWIPQEHVAAGVPFERRGARFEEYLRCLHALWTQDPVEFDGEFYAVPPSRLGIRPVQQTHPPVLVGGSAPAALRRAGRLAQGWIASSKQDDGIEAAVSLVRDGAAEAGRDPDALRILVRRTVDLRADEMPGARAPMQGTRDQILDDLAALRGRGATEVLLDLNVLPRVGSPHADAGEAVAYAEQVLDAFAPAAPASD